MVLETLDQDHH